VVTTELNESVVSLLSDLRRFYQRQKTTNPLKAKKRLVNGLREVLRAADRNKLKMAILAPNIDEVAAPG
jgi:ribosomal protein L7Ae-like RNA K-turn-binding protein